MERRNSEEWLNSLKIAIINYDIKKLEEYSSRKVPEFSSIEKAKTALALIKQATEIIKLEKDKIGKKLQALKQARKYNQTTQHSTMSFQA